MALAAWTAITYLVPSRVRTTPSAEAVNHMGVHSLRRCHRGLNRSAGCCWLPPGLLPLARSMADARFERVGANTLRRRAPLRSGPVYDARDQAQQRGESQRRYPPDARN